jgi:hypothetical protein
LFFGGFVFCFLGNARLKVQSFSVISFDLIDSEMARNDRFRFCFSLLKEQDAKDKRPWYRFDR